MGEAGVSEFFSMNQNLKYFFFFFWGGGGWGAGGARVSVFFFTKDPNLKKKGGGRGAGWGVVDGWTVEQAQTNLPLHLLRSWGHNNALVHKLCP